MSGVDAGDDGPIVTEVRGPIFVIAINRPQVRNAIDLDTACRIAEAVDRFDADPDLRAGVVTGRQGVFSAGMDLKAFASGERPTVPGRGFAGVTSRPPAKPLIAAIEGYAFAGGFEVALACDLIVAARDAILGFPEVTRGLIASAGGLIRLPRAIPHYIAMEMVLTGDTITAPRAYQLGLVNRLTEPGAAFDAALSLATRIAAQAPLAVVGSKRSLIESHEWPVADAFRRQHEISDPIRESEDALEGARAFIERRAPVWRGR